jgi:hypothetical protein
MKGYYFYDLVLSFWFFFADFFLSNRPIPKAVTEPRIVAGSGTGSGSTFGSTGVSVSAPDNIGEKLLLSSNNRKFPGKSKYRKSESELDELDKLAPFVNVPDERKNWVA